MSKNRISAKPIISNMHHKPSTITRAAITADLKLTRDKQLVEHDPFELIPDPHNPRPGEKIDDSWIISMLKLKTPERLCFKDGNNTYHIPTFEQLNITEAQEVADSYNFLRELAFSIRRDGLIEPIEIYLADRDNDPEYFTNTDKDYAYVILEGHQRRLAAMMAGVETVTCIQIIDEATLAKLKVKHRKLRRQLSENNIRKALTVSQNFQVLSELLKNEEAMKLSIKELSEIIALNEDIVGALRKACLLKDSLPKEFYEVINQNLINYGWIRKWVGKSSSEILIETNRLKSNDIIVIKPILEKNKSRGKEGGAIKRSATIKISDEKDTIIVRNYLINRIPELANIAEDKTPFHHLEMLFKKVLELAKKQESDPDRI